MYRQFCLNCISKLFPSKFFKSNIDVVFNSRRSAFSTAAHDLSEKDFSPKTALLIRKVTRYEYEKYYLKPDFTEDQLREYLNSPKHLDEHDGRHRDRHPTEFIYVTGKGSDYAALVLRHDEYFRSLDEIQNSFQKRGIKHKLIHRYDYEQSLVDWADVIFTAGGDGTFLMAASKVGGRSKPVIGINTDPLRSEGFLCLPKQYSRNIGLALDKILKGDFQWFWRQRIRLTMFGNHANDLPVDLHNQQMLYPEHRFWEHVRESEQMLSSRKFDDIPGNLPPRILPGLALNEVFIGEKLSSRVSFYEVSIDGSKQEKQKSSGITICPGTGSTSWYFNINNVTKMTVKEILRIAQKYRGCTEANLKDDKVLEKIVDEFNNALVFDPEDLKMAYSIRDPLSAGIFHINIEPRGFCNKIRVKSRMWDACVVVDGSLSYTFNDGAIVEMELREEDALRCVKLSD